MFNAAIHSNEKYANIDEFNCLKSKLSGDALQATYFRLPTLQ